MDVTFSLHHGDGVGVDVADDVDDAPVHQPRKEGDEIEGMVEGLVHQRGGLQYTALLDVVDDFLDESDLPCVQVAAVDEVGEGLLDGLSVDMGNFP